MHSDTIADMLTRVRNAVRSGHADVNVKANRVCEGIAKVLLEQGYIADYDRISTASKQDLLHITLKYGPLGEQVINTIKRKSKPSCRLYCSADELPKVMGGLGISVVSTSTGVLSDQQCREKNIGGELLCEVT